MSDSKWKALLLTAMLIIGLAGGVSLYIIYDYNTTGRFPGGTRAGGVDISQLAVPQAVMKLEKTLQPADELRYQFKLQDRVSETSGAQLGARLDTRQYLEGVLRHEKERFLIDRLWSRGVRKYALTIPISYDRKKYDDAMGRISLDLERKPKNARVQFAANGSMAVKSGTDGYRIDLARTFAALPDTYSAGTQLTVPVAADVVSADVGSFNPAEQVALAQFTTRFSGSNLNRSSNLRKAAASINGVIVPKGFEFSFNECVGPRDIASGYKEAMIILKNEFIPGIGGGVCQVSTTLYNAALRAGLKITERHNHSVAVAYVPVGYDATLAYPAKDLRFVNVTSQPIWIKTSVKGNYITVAIFGAPADRVRVELEREVTKSIPFTVVQKPDPTLPTGKTKLDHAGTNGFLVESYRLFLNPDNSVHAREKLATDRYAPLNATVLVGTGPAEAVALPPETNVPAEVEPVPAEVPAEPAPTPAPTPTPGGNETNAATDNQ